MALSEKLKQLASSLLGKDKLLNGIVVFHRHCFAALDVFDSGVFMADLSYCNPDDIVTISFSRANGMLNQNL